jgi:hypothetical protein
MADSTLNDPASPSSERVLDQECDHTTENGGAMPSVESPPEDKIYCEYYQQSEEITLQRNVAYETATIKTEN